MTARDARRAVVRTYRLPLLPGALPPPTASASFARLLHYDGTSLKRIKIHTSAEERAKPARNHAWAWARPKAGGQEERDSACPASGSKTSFYSARLDHTLDDACKTRTWSFILSSAAKEIPKPFWSRVHECIHASLNWASCRAITLRRRGQSLLSGRRPSPSSKSVAIDPSGISNSGLSFCIQQPLCTMSSRNQFATAWIVCD